MRVCKICNSSGDIFAESQVMRVYRAQWWQCGNCGFVCPVEAPWLAEAYKSAINFSDVGLVSRSINASNDTCGFLSQVKQLHGPYCDYGGGYGLFVRLMRDRGHNFFWSDPYCENLFAKMFEGNRQQHFEMVTAFEVFEHLEDPHHGLKEMLDFSKVILISTCLLPKPRPLPEDWWYYGLDHGQHISLYTTEALQILAESHGLRYKYLKYNYHLFYPLDDSRFDHILSVKPRLTFRERLIHKILGAEKVLKKSLLLDDYDLAIKTANEWRK
jgi:ferredoxin